jgi:hypothetical protein
MTPAEAYQRLQQILQHVNMVWSAFQSERYMSEADAVLAYEEARVAAAEQVGDWLVAAVSWLLAGCCIAVAAVSGAALAGLQRPQQGLADKLGAEAWPRADLAGGPELSKRALLPAAARCLCCWLLPTRGPLLLPLPFPTCRATATRRPPPQRTRTRRICSSRPRATWPLAARTTAGRSGAHGLPGLRAATSRQPAPALLPKQGARRLPC